MSKIALSGNASGTGTFTLASPNSSTNRTLDLPDASGVVVLDTATQTLTNKTLGSGLVAGASLLTSGTANTISGTPTSIDFTGIPSWVKRITVMLNGVSTNGSSLIQIKLGDSGGIENTGYSSGSSYSLGDASSTTGFLATSVGNSLYAISGSLIFTNISSNIWVLNGVTAWTSGTTGCSMCSGTKTLSDTLTQVRITTVNGTDTFDNGGIINILYE